MRQSIINFILGAAILLIGVVGFRKLSDMKKARPEILRNQVANVLIDTVHLKDESILISSNGTLKAKNRIDIIPKVQGVFQRSGRNFKDGVNFRKGDLLVQIDNRDVLSNLESQKSQFQQALVSMLPDLKFDYPEAFEKWEKYTNEFQIKGKIQALPEVDNEREKSFVTLRNIYVLFYGIKAVENNLRHYQIYAPFSGILSDVAVFPGSLLSPGQKMAELIDPSDYEIEVKIPSKFIDILGFGKTVELEDLYSNRSWQGTIKRVLPKLDINSQSNIAIVELQGKELKTGMFLQAKLPTQLLKDVYELDRNLLIDGQYAFVLQDSILSLQAVEVVHYKEESVLVEGLKENQIVLSNNIPGAYEGMKVNVLSAN
jgi:multidrug efflux pump subunit AcrA (membrane-fusion protein)